MSRKRVQRLLRAMGLWATYRRPGTSRRSPEHPVCPYLTCWPGGCPTPPDRGRGQALEAGFCAEALEEALEKGRPEVFNTDQGSQFTSLEFTQVLQDRGVRISMDGKGRYQDNIFVERLWRTVKYEEVYLKPMPTS